MNETFFCGMSNPDPDSPSNIRWEFNGNRLENGQRVHITLLASSSTVMLTAVTYAETGSYTCIISNLAGSSNQTTIVDVTGRYP